MVGKLVNPILGEKQVPQMLIPLLTNQQVTSQVFFFRGELYLELRQNHKFNKNEHTLMKMALFQRIMICLRLPES